MHGFTLVIVLIVPRSQTNGGWAGGSCGTREDVKGSCLEGTGDKGNTVGKRGDGVYVSKERG